MEHDKLVLPEYDVERLKRLLDSDTNDRDHDGPLLNKLSREIDRAIVVPSREIPADVVTMNSRVKITDLEDGEQSVYTLVFPSDADIEKNKLSVLAPLGLALAGRRTGSTIEWKTPGGVACFRIDEIEYQPESAGVYPI